MAELNLNRRGFLKSTAALSLSLSFAPQALAAKAGAAFSPHGILRIESDNTVRIMMPHADLGSGIYTGLAQILADELDAAWSQVRTEHLTSLDAEFKHQQWGVIATGASTSVNNQWQQFRHIGATARAMLRQAAAERWGIDAASLQTRESMVINPASGDKLNYGELTAAAAELVPPKKVALKNSGQFELIGKALPRLDAKTKADGSAVFGIDVTLPEMLHAAVAHPPVFGGKLKSVDAAAAKAMPGVKAVVELPTGVAVVADSFWRAKKAKDALKIAWDDGAFAGVSQADLWQNYRELAKTEGLVFEQRGKLEFDDTQKTLEGEMRFPFLAHAAMEPLSATVQLSDAQCEIWASTQFQGIDAGNIEKATGIAASRIKINTQWLGGSFGRRASPQSDFLVEAVRIAQAARLPNPIKMLWQREDDMNGGLYRPMVLHQFKVALDESGRPAHWRHHVVAKPIAVGTPFEAAFVKDNIDSLSIEGLVHNHYHAANVDYRLHNAEHAVSVCWLRGEADLHTGPVVESIINRLARMANEDPFDYRLRLLAGNDAAKRKIGVLKTLRAASRWDDAVPEDVVRGMAIHESFGSVCGFVVSLRKAADGLRFDKVTAAFDCGLVINPDAVKAQVYSSVAFALSTVIGQQIEIERGRARQTNFDTYVVAALADTPDVEVHLVDNGLDHPTGAGEVPVPPFIPALTEALYQASGEEVNEFPLDPATLKLKRSHAV